MALKRAGNVAQWESTCLACARPCTLKKKKKALKKPTHDPSTIAQAPVRKFMLF
jgi:hypothetical protein